MEHVFRNWIEGKTGRRGYSVAVVTFYAEDYNEGNTKYAKDRKTLNAAKNDALKLYKENPESWGVAVWANAVLTDYYEDGTQHGKPYTDSVKLGTIDGGKYCETYEQVGWL